MSLERLNKLVRMTNIADDLDADELGRIGDATVREYELDLATEKDWREDYKKACELALQVAEAKNYPWKNAANIKYPLLTTAAMQFAARAYPAIVSSSNMVKAKVNGQDKDGQKRQRGERISRHMSWQLLQEMPDWEEGTDKLLHILPIAGMCYRKTYFAPDLGRNCSELVEPDKLVVNDGVKSLDTAPRITHEIEVYPQEMEERFRGGTYKRIEPGPADGSDEDAPHDFLEQHRSLDLDDDGYKEPYIVTVHRDTAQVVRIVANFRAQGITIDNKGGIVRIERDLYFTKFGFVPNPSGGFHDIGFGYLLRPINEAVNSTINQLLDAGHLANVGGGFIGAGARLRGGSLRFRPGEWKPVDVGGAALRDNLVPLPVKEPSLVLFQLLGLLIEAGKDISSVKDVLTGETQGRNESPTTTLAMIEQGMQVFTAIYKRIFRALKMEYEKLYRLNSMYLEDGETYFTLLDDPEAVKRDDYAVGDFDITPMADPNMVTNMQRLGRAEFMMQFATDPYFNPLEVRKRLLDAANIEDPEELLVEEAPPDPGMAAEADKLDIEKRKLALEEFKAQSEAMKRRAEVMKLIAEAEAAEAGPQLEIYKQEAALLEAIVKGSIDVEKGRLSKVEGTA